MKASDLVMSPIEEGGVAVLLPDPRPCPDCHRAVAIVINRFGRTRCPSCTLKVEAEIQAALVLP